MSIQWTSYGDREFPAYYGGGYEIRDYTTSWDAYYTWRVGQGRYMGAFPTLRAAKDACEADLKRQPHYDGEA